MGTKDSRAHSRKHLEHEIVSLASRLQPSDVPWTVFTAHLIFITFPPSEMPLHIHFNISLPSITPSLPSTSSQLSYLSTSCATFTATPHCLRAQTWRLRVDSCPPSLPSLHTLNLKCVTPLDLEPTDLLQMRSASTPKLRTLDLDDLQLPWTLPLFRGLAHLYVQERRHYIVIDFQTFYDVLAACPELESLRLDFTGPNPSKSQSDTLPTPILLPKLCRLELIDLMPASTTLVMHIIAKIPATATLNISWAYHNFGAFSFDSSGPGTGKIRIYGEGMTDPQVLELLSYLPSVNTACYASSMRSRDEVLDHLLAMLGSLDMRQLKTLVMEEVYLSVIVEALHQRIGDDKILADLGISCLQSTPDTPGW
ncbi:hypothetical protein EVG20_g11612 [Dentipellis fragilis]|uniref:F-box domain-containing protein n=1 Tax=Dentipellis fragilis TaxID=205917 RepID=A0A4Y9XM62_9AGAM|nr:hypothetical protein EVG20_g11612 [Dentipellis fragilis]